MKTLHRYLTQQVVASLLMAALVFTFILMIGNVLRDVLTLLVGGAASPLMVLEAVGLLIPYVWAFALPMALLTAVVLVFGRFSADHELTAARASGISLVSLAAPILVLSLVLCGICALVNLEIAPRCWHRYKDMISNLDAKAASAILPEKTYIKNFPGYVFYFERKHGDYLEDITVLMLQDGTNMSAYVHAPTGQVREDKVAHKIILDLNNSKSVIMAGDTPRPGFSETYTLMIDFDPNSEARKPGIREMTFGQLQKELHDVEARIRAPFLGGTNVVKEDIRREIERQRGNLTAPIRVLLHQQVALSFACFGFALIGIPLGIRVHRRETNVGFAVAIVLVLVYYSFLLAGQSVASRSVWLPYLFVWLPNFILQAVGIVLLRRANRGI